MRLGRRDFIQTAASMGAALAWGGRAHASRTNWREERDRYPEGVASGDPDQNSVILWTRRPYGEGDRHLLTVEIATDPLFRHVIGQAPAPVSAASDWTARVLVGKLKPATTYWYRFTDSAGNGSRVGRTRTAPRPDDTRPVNFAFVSCQSVNEGTLNAYRRMIFEDEKAAPYDQIDFILHLGDFIYEVVQYPEEVSKRYDRTIYEVARLSDSLKISNFYIPTTVDGYRAIYRGYLKDPDLQEARARWPFVCMWDNHEFSWQGWQSFLKAGSIERPAQTIKVAANQAWFEYIPARIARRGNGSLERFDPPTVADVPLDRFDQNGLSHEPNNLAAINSLTAYRALRYGRHLDLIITDQYSYRGASPYNHPELDELGQWGNWNGMFPEDVMKVLDGGRAFNGSKPPAELRFNDKRIANPRTSSPPQTILGADQKAWLKERLRQSSATWKIWGNSLGTLEWRADPHNLPLALTNGQQWPAGSYANLGGSDYGSAWVERAEIYNLVRDAKISGFAVVSGDRHSFWAGYAAAQLPPGKFDPVGLSFIAASLASPGAIEAYEHRLPKDLPLRALYLADRPGGKPEATFNMLLRHGVRACLDYAKNGDRKRARSLSNPELAPHLKFVDMSAHGYAKVRLTGAEIRTEFVCIPRPVTRATTPDGGPLRYRVAQVAKLWKAGERPALEMQLLEGDPGLGW